MKLTLASGSEWRKKLLEWLELSFEVKESGVDENIYDCEEPDELVAMLAAAKARKVASEVREGLVLGADTVIVLDGEIMGKPKDRKHAKEMVRSLLGREHEVYTGVCLMSADSEDMRVETEVSGVKFSTMSEKQLKAYLDTNEWKGKAGGYQIQKAIKPYVYNVEGSYTNIIGLPLLMVESLLEDFGYGLEVDVKKVIEKRSGYPS